MVGVNSRLSLGENVSTADDAFYSVCLLRLPCIYVRDNVCVCVCVCDCVCVFELAVLYTKENIVKIEKRVQGCFVSRMVIYTKVMKELIYMSEYCLFL